MSLKIDSKYIKTYVDKTLKPNEKIINLKKFKQLHSKTKTHIQNLSVKKKNLLQDYLNKKKIDQNKFNILNNIFRFYLNQNKINKKNTTLKQIQPDKLNKCFGKYKMISQLGAGFFGITYLVEKDNKQYCIKTIQIYSDNDYKKIENEIKISKDLGKHKICPKVYDAYICKETGVTRAYIVMEYMNGGTLNKWMENNMLTKKDKESIKLKLNKLHKLKYIHRDIQGDNILVHKNNQNKPEFFISDFGISFSFTDIVEDGKTSDIQCLEQLFKHQIVIDRIIAQLFVICGII